ncbi:hypothetical protein GCL60_16390 [Silvanigrella paludirubra]|uniref:Uncharacterized protein n=1 Tax=Silvanigrella paludirubra TaxID=2499159 RepID=A0A6N6VP62_9BACT|nr:hypothetical protein [Silvanigrella paludirubra]KAB8035807.1 hypothetical protein GCL60_16390 [Silvanigrella paludirubra]
MKAKIAYNYYFDYESKIDTWPEGTSIVPHEDHKTSIYDKEKDDYIINDYYFEIYSKNPDSYFCSPSAKTLEEAEKLGYKKFQEYVNCIEHEFERRNYTTGVGYCKHCNLFKSEAFLPSTLCIICKQPTNFCYDSIKNYYCEDHAFENKDEKYLNEKKELELFKEKMKKIKESKFEREKFKESLKNVMHAIADSVSIEK